MVSTALRPFTHHAHLSTNHRINRSPTKQWWFRFSWPFCYRAPARAWCSYSTSASYGTRRTARVSHLYRSSRWPRTGCRRRSWTSCPRWPGKSWCWGRNALFVLTRLRAGNRLDWFPVATTGSMYSVRTPGFLSIRCVLCAGPSLSLSSSMALKIRAKKFELICMFIVIR